MMIYLLCACCSFRFFLAIFATQGQTSRLLFCLFLSVFRVVRRVCDRFFTRSLFTCRFVQSIHRTTGEHKQKCIAKRCAVVVLLISRFSQFKLVVQCCCLYCSREEGCPGPDTRVFSGLNRVEQALFVSLICGAIAVNAWFLNFNLQRMRYSHENPSSQVSLRQLKEMPSFAIVLHFFRTSAPRLKSCFEGHRVSVEIWKDRRPCNMIEIPDHVFNTSGYAIIWPTLVFTDTFEWSDIELINVPQPGSYFAINVLSPDKVNRYISTNWVPAPESGLRVIYDETHPLNIGLELSATQYVNGSVDYDFKMFAQRWIKNTTANEQVLDMLDWAGYYVASWNTLSVTFTWQDVVVSQASILSATLFLFNFLFPFRAVTRHTFRCFWRQRGKFIDRVNSMPSSEATERFRTASLPLSVNADIAI